MNQEKSVDFKALDFGAIMEASIAAGDKRIAEERAYGVKNYVMGEAILAGDGPKRFNTLSLRDWNVVADKAGVLRLPAALLGDIAIETPFILLDHEALPAEEAASWDGILKALNAQEGEFFLRWDHCSGMDVKQAVNSGEGVREILDHGYFVSEENGRRNILLDDFRMADILPDYHSPRLPLYARPKVAARMVKGIEGGSYPAEWRAYVMDGQLRAISNYYPQTVRDNDPETRATLRLVARQVLLLLRCLDEHRAQPWHMIYDRAELDPKRIHCTLDFLEGADGRLYLVEGGPVTLAGWGAHPCCFLTEDGGKPLEGIALSTKTVIDFSVLGA